MTTTSATCKECGCTATEGDRFCSNCGASLQSPEPEPVSPEPEPVEPSRKAARGRKRRPRDDREISWTDRSHILGWNIATKQLIILVVLSLVIMQLALLVMGLIVNGEVMILPWRVFAITGGVLVGLILIAVFLFMGNRVNMEVTVNARGMGFLMSRRDRRFSRFAIIAGLLTRSPQAVGAGLLAASRESGFISWGSVERVRIHDRDRGIALYGGVLPLIEVFCPEDVFPEVVQIIESRVAQVEHV